MVTSIKGNATSTFGGNVDVTGNVVTDAPAFSAYLNTLQLVSNNTWTKIAYDTKEFDTSGNYDTSTNYRFTPTVAGYYQVNATFYVETTENRIHMGIYKNGSIFKRGVRFNADNDGVSESAQSVVSALIYLNGSTDYIEIYGLHTGGSTKNVSADSTLNYFQAFLARAV